MSVTPAQLRQLALALPGSEEKSHFEQPDFRVHNKIFAGLARDAKTGSLKLTPELQGALLEAREAAFYPAAGAWGRSGWTHVVLAEVELGELRELLGESWRLVAPKRLSAATPAAPTPAKRAAPERVPAKRAAPKRVPAKRAAPKQAPAKPVQAKPKAAAKPSAAKTDALKKRARKGHRA